MERKLRKSCESSVQSRTVEERTDRRQRGNAGRGNIWGAREGKGIGRSFVKINEQC